MRQGSRPSGSLLCPQCLELGAKGLNGEHCAQQAAEARARRARDQTPVRPWGLEPGSGLEQVLVTCCVDMSESLRPAGLSFPFCPRRKTV